MYLTRDSFLLNKSLVAQITRTFFLSWAASMFQSEGERRRDRAKADRSNNRKRRKQQWLDDCPSLCADIIRTFCFGLVVILCVAVCMGCGALLVAPIEWGRVNPSYGLWIWLLIVIIVVPSVLYDDFVRFCQHYRYFGYGRYMEDDWRRRQRQQQQ